MINTKIFDSNLLKINKKLYKDFDIYYIGYVTMKDFVDVNVISVNPLHFIIGEVDGQIEK